MIDVEVNGQRDVVTLASLDELRGYLQCSTPEGQVICQLRVNGQERAEATLDPSELATIRSLEVRTATPHSLARGALAETVEWIGRIATGLEKLASDFRLGRQAAASDRLVEVLDALQVLLGLLAGIRAELVPDEGPRDCAPWNEAEGELLEAVGGLEVDLVAGDPVRLADRAGYALPRALERFRSLLQELER